MPAERGMEEVEAAAVSERWASVTSRLASDESVVTIVKRREVEYLIHPMRSSPGVSAPSVN